jgi:ABC-2 type transport system ATP-binding protein
MGGEEMIHKSSFSGNDGIQIHRAVEVSNISKRFGDLEAARDISFDVGAGEMFGVIGPNGAGKTTVIRMLMDIITPDSGNIRIMGEPLQESTKNRIGYLPEERGLYKKLTVADTLSYLALLKGVSGSAIRDRATRLLDRMGMLPHQNKKIEELSKGMAQLIQFIAAIVHDPQLVILDEPFYGLDPVNTRLVKDVLRELHEQGKAIILSTHMMNEVEELCDRILMINKGRAVLYGDLAEIKARYRTNSVIVSAEGDLGRIEGVLRAREDGSSVELFLDGKTSPQKILTTLVNRNVPVNRFEVATPPLSEIFIEVVRGHHE